MGSITANRQSDVNGTVQDVEEDLSWLFESSSKSLRISYFYSYSSRTSSTQFFLNGYVLIQGLEQLLLSISSHWDRGLNQFCKPTEFLSHLFIYFVSFHFFTVCFHLFMVVQFILRSELTDPKRFAGSK